MSKKKEIRNKYKQTVQPMGIFIVKNIQTGKVLIGKSTNLPGKINSIRFQLETGSCMNRELQKDFREYGGDQFLFETLDMLEPDKEPGYDYSDELNVLEKMWLEKLQPYCEKGYNNKEIKE